MGQACATTRQTLGLAPKAGLWRRLGRVLALGGALAAAAVLQAAAPAGPTEAELKAAVVYQITRFVEWPPAQPTNAPLVIGLAGDGPLLQALAALLPSAKPVQGRPLTILPLPRNFSATNVHACQVLVVGEGLEHVLPGLLSGAASGPALTISDLAEFCARGGMVGLRMEDQRVQLEVNTNACERAQVRLSSRLLRQARLISPPSS